MATLPPGMGQQDQMMQAPMGDPMAPPNDFPGMDTGMGATESEGFASLDPAQVASVLLDVLKRMQEDDQYRMQVQMQMAQLAMGDEQKASAEQAIGALRAALAQEGVTLDGPGSIPPPGMGGDAPVPTDEMGRLQQAAYPAA